MASTSYQSEKFDLFSFVAPKKSKANNAFGDLIAKLTTYLFIPFNLIFYKYGAPEKVISTFDFRQNSFAFDFKKLIYPVNYILPNSPNKYLWQHLIVNEKNDNPFSTIARAFYFIQEKGFKIDKTQYLKLIKLAASEDITKNNLYLQNISIHS